MTTLRYFAYGSNMLRERLVARVSTAQVVAVGVVRDFRRDFAKVGADGSGKGDMVASSGGEVWGVLYEFDASQRVDLDRHEGPHYEAKEVIVLTPSGDEAAWAYMSKPGRRDTAMLPYDWYLALVVAGALQHGLGELAAELRNLPVKKDPECQRPARLEALRVLREAGFPDVADGLER